jgi:glycosyltransferase involved in cell wall biosynthesis
MAVHSLKPHSTASVAKHADGVAEPGLPRRYGRACRFVLKGRIEQARRLYAKLRDETTDPRLQSLVANDLAVLAALEGRLDEAREGWQAGLEFDACCLPARLNRDLVEADAGLGAGRGNENAASAPGVIPAVVPARTEPRPPEPTGPPDSLISTLVVETQAPDAVRRVEGFGASPDLSLRGSVGTRDVAEAGLATAVPDRQSRAPIKVAILSFLFNWPSTGGGNVHTVELARFLGAAGYEVRHFHARYAAWGIGRVDDALPVASETLEFSSSTWGLAEIQARYRRAVEAFCPDYIIVTDAWNMKPLLAEAVEGYPYFLRFQAQECLCPLNNLRLLASGPGTFEQCPKNQIATPDVCGRCVAERGHHSGSLHQRERSLCEVGTPLYERNLRRALEGAEAVLVLNPLIGSLLEPYARRVRVVPWGMDPARFPWPPDGGPEGGRPTVGLDGGVLRRAPTGGAAPAVVSLFMAAVHGEVIKGFHVAHEACRLLRQSRSDFELVVTFDPPGRIDEFTRSVGWRPQVDLPRHYRAADVCLVPTIAQEGLSRTSVEAMASGIPVIASRIGGLPYTVVDGVTGLLFEPGDAADLARQIARLLDDPPLRRRMGLAGRARFEEEFTWETVIERYYRPMLEHRPV